MVVAKAQLFASLDEYEQSLELYDQVVKFRPDDEGIALSRAELLLRMGRLDDRTRCLCERRASAGPTVRCR